MSEFILSTVTIGIPVYNEEKNLAISIESAIKQTYKNIQILISDNCSADNSYKIALEYSEKDSRIKIFRQQENIGTANFEFLLGKANSEYFCFLGGHDVLKENFVEESIKLFNSNSKIVGVYPLVEYFKTDLLRVLNTNITVVNVYPDVEIIEKDILFKENWGDKFNTLNLNSYESIKDIIGKILGGNSFYGMYKRQIMLKSFFHDQKDGFGDLGAVLRASAYGCIVPTSEVCSYFRIIRHHETDEQLDARYKSYNFPDNWRVVHAAYPFTFLNKNDQLTINEKLRLNIEVHDKIKKFYNLSWSKLLRFYLKKSEIKLCILILLSYLRYLYRKSKRALKYSIKSKKQ